MAMLAAPRKKQKFSIDPRGSSWSKDESKYGQKMLEKMGWSKGRGLGANEDGRVEHVKISHKDDNRGVGCSKNHADRWIAHQDDFDSLLANLNEVYVNKDEPVAKQPEVMNLEKKSKSVKSRIHYQKFIKSKDLSSRKLEDLDCVFGRRKSKQPKKQEDKEEWLKETEIEEETDNFGVQTFESSVCLQSYFAKKMAEQSESNSPKQFEEPSDGQKVEKSESLKEIENSNQGMKTFNSSQNLQEYFAQKMAALKNAASLSSNEKPEQNEVDQSESVDSFLAETKNQEIEQSNSKKKKKHKKRKCEDDKQISFDSTKKKSKKEKNNKNETKSEDGCGKIGEAEVAKQKKVKTSKKEKKCINENDSKGIDNYSENNADGLLHENVIKKSKKGKKCNSDEKPEILFEEIVNKLAESEDTPEEDVTRKSKKKKKNSSKDKIEETEINKPKDREVGDNNKVPLVEETENVHKKSKKKSKKKDKTEKCLDENLAVVDNKTANQNNVESKSCVEKCIPGRAVTHDLANETMRKQMKKELGQKFTGSNICQIAGYSKIQTFLGD